MSCYSCVIRYFDKSAHMIMWEQPLEFELQVINSFSEYMSN